MSLRVSRRRAFLQFSSFLAGSPLLRGQFVPRDKHRRVPSLDEIASVFEFEPVAQAKITKRAYDFVAGGVEDEFSLRRNREAYDWATLIPRTMADVSSVDAGTELLGQRMDFPILICPTAGHQQLHPDGEQETHRGATAAGATMLVSHNSSFPLDQVAAAAKGPLWAQLYIKRDLGQARERVEEAMAAGYRAICLTADNQYNSHRERLLHDRNLSEPRRSPRGQRGSRRGRGRQAPEYPFGLGPEDPQLTWSIIETLRSWTNLPLLVKGIMTGEDAKLAVEHGVDAIIVSNHGARYLSYAPSTFEVLPEVVEAVQGQIPVLIDSGIRRGTDVLKALAVGARAVCVGRPPLWGLGAFGAAGVERVLTLLQAELLLAMANTGRATIADINKSLVETNFP